MPTITNDIAVVPVRQYLTKRITSKMPYSSNTAHCGARLIEDGAKNSRSADSNRNRYKKKLVFERPDTLGGTEQVGEDKQAPG